MGVAVDSRLCVPKPDAFHTNIGRDISVQEVRRIPVPQPLQRHVNHLAAK